MVQIQCAEHIYVAAFLLEFLQTLRALRFTIDFEEVNVNWVTNKFPAFLSFYETSL